jgi:nucleotide-binding universal stress UspA family protein
MDRALVVVADTDTGRRLLSEAGSITAGIGAELIVLNVVDVDEYTDAVQRTATQGERTKAADEVAAEAEREAAAIADAALEGIDVDYDPVGVVGELPDAILDAAAERDCDHVFVVGRHRSPTGKVVFGDVAQSVVLNFDGPVTVLVEDA